jgi:hypothetical protein
MFEQVYEFTIESDVHIYYIAVYKMCECVTTGENK